MGRNWRRDTTVVQQVGGTRLCCRSCVFDVIPKCDDMCPASAVGAPHVSDFSITMVSMVGVQVPKARRVEYVSASQPAHTFTVEHVIHADAAMVLAIVVDDGRLVVTCCCLAAPTR